MGFQEEFKDLQARSMGGKGIYGSGSRGATTRRIGADPEDILAKALALDPSSPNYKAEIGKARRAAAKAGMGYSVFDRQIQESRGGELEAEAKAAVEEAKEKQEASKVSALGYYDKAAGDIAASKEAATGFYQPFAEEIAEMPRELIDPAMREEMEATRRTQLGAYGQNLAGQFGDAGSGVQSGKRAEIGMGIAGMQADLPIELQLEIAEKNRQAKLGVIGAGVGVAGAQAGVEGTYANLGLGVASGKAGVETAYQYDPGLEYIKSLGYNQGYQNTLGSSGGGGTTTTTSSFSSAPKPKATTTKPKPYSYRQPFQASNTWVSKGEGLVRV